MFEPIFEVPVHAVISIVTKGEFGNSVINAIELPQTEGVDLQPLTFQEATHQRLSDSDLVFVIADELSPEEWAKIYQPTQTLIVVVGCSAPTLPVPGNSCFIKESSVQLCSKAISSVMNIVWGSGLIQVDFAGIKYALEKCESGSVVGYVSSMLAEDVTGELLKQFYDKGMLLEDAKGILINLVMHPESDFFDINKVTDKLFEVVSEDAYIAIGTTIDFTLEKDKIDLCMIAVM